MQRCEPLGSSANCKQQLANWLGARDASGTRLSQYECKCSMKAVTVDWEAARGQKSAWKQDLPASIKQEYASSTPALHWKQIILEATDDSIPTHAWVKHATHIGERYWHNREMQQAPTLAQRPVWHFDCAGTLWHLTLEPLAQKSWLRRDVLRWRARRRTLAACPSIPPLSRGKLHVQRGARKHLTTTTAVNFRKLR